MLYLNRLYLKGESKKLALIEVENKLIKQAFSIAKSGLKYDENFVRSNLLIHNLYFIGILPQFIVVSSWIYFFLFAFL